jgi:hypothetical protein
VKRCPSCGQSNQNDAAFCIQCGFGLSAVASEPTAGEPAAPAPFGAGYLPKATVIDGKYEVDRVLGEGGMGVVYLARDVHTEMPVVIKSIRAELADTPEFRSRTLAEGRALARIDHPNVVRLNAVVVEPRGLYLVMQYIDGEPLDRLIARWVSARAHMPLAPALSIFRMILRGVGAAHGEGLIHRDLKPANVLVRAKDGVAKVTDFGIAKGEEDAKAGRGLTQGIIGSLSYMAPEQVRGVRDLDKRVDIYALGILLFELLTGRVPFEAPSDYELMRMQAESPLPSILSFRPDLPASLDAALQRACAKDRARRFSSTDEFLAALEGLENAPVVAPPAVGPGQTVLADPPLGQAVQAPHVAAAAHVAAGGAGHTVRANAATEIATQSDPSAWASPGAGTGTAARAAWSGPRPGEIASTSMDDSVAIPLHSRPTRRIALWIGVGVGVVAAAGGAALYLSEAEPARTASDHAAADAAAAKNATATTVPATATATTAPTTGAANNAAEPSGAAPARPTDSLAALAGNWKSSSNREYAAVVSGDSLQFRIQKAAQHPRQGYENGDVRFALRVVDGSPSQFAVVDYLRPTPPPGFEYDEARSRESCIGTWSEIKGRPLTARYDGGKTLNLQLALIRTGADKFKMQGNRVVGCVEVATAPAQVIESQLTRVP